MTIIVDADSAAMTSVDGQQAWPELIGAKFIGARGKTVLDALADLPSVIEQKPSHYICQFGLWSAWCQTGSYVEPIEAFYHRMVWLVSSLREAGIKTIVVTPPVYLANTHYLYDVRRYGMTALSSSLATSVFGIDADRRMHTESIHNPNWKDWFMLDDQHYHLSPVGHQKVASYLRPLL
jgi:hypothetical protein